MNFPKTEREYPKDKRLKIIIGGGIFFLIVVPYIFFFLSSPLARWLKVPDFSLNPSTLLIGITISIGGLSLAFWTVIVQFAEGKGTPMPLAPTQKLITYGPYKYTRNPMALGTSLYYIGIGISLDSPSFLIISIIAIILLLAYIKLFEEKELEERFKEEYRKYKETAPFFIPIPKK